MHSWNGLSGSRLLQALGASRSLMRKTWTVVPLVNAWTTEPDSGSISAAASRTSTPVIVLISSRSACADEAKSCR